ncbi:DMT family transporter [Reinekea thalattae]|uniref:EamA family transporter n=1 Tax=Reinekea thalattae TaxID=2593301 RepID=A0A5C8Z7J6_9GAMM|nr:DMT family transporter [Reinekea thalattae]TXR53617.1 EamA family transporter [Reinekea thalattae]
MTGTILVIFATFFWALDTLIRYPLMDEGVSAVNIVLIEHFILVLGFWLWFTVRRHKFWPFDRKDLFALVVIGGFGSAIGTLTFTQAFSYMNPTLVILLQKLQPVVAISLSAWLLKERLSSGYLLCVVLAFSGSFMLMYHDIIQFLATSGWHYTAELSARLMGYGLALIAVVSWGASTVFGKKLSMKGYSSSQIMNGRFSVGLLVLLPLFLLNSPLEQTVSLLQVEKIALMVLLSGALGMLLYYQGLKRIDSKHSALAEMAFPLMAGVINWLVLDITLTPIQLVGSCLLVLGSFVVHVDVAQWLQKFTKRQTTIS